MLTPFSDIGESRRPAPISLLVWYAGSVSMCSIKSSVYSITFERTVSRSAAVGSKRRAVFSRARSCLRIGVKVKSLGNRDEGAGQG